MGVHPDYTGMTTPHPVLEQTASQNKHPFNSSYYLPEKVCGRAVLFLIDTGCMTNIPAKHVCDRMPGLAWQLVYLCKDAHGTLVEGSAMPFYGLMELLCRIRNMASMETSLVSPCKEEAILGMLFLLQHDRTMKSTDQR